MYLSRERRNKTMENVLSQTISWHTVPHKSHHVCTYVHNTAHKPNTHTLPTPGCTYVGTLLPHPWIWNCTGYLCWSINITVWHLYWQQGVITMSVDYCEGLTRDCMDDTVLCHMTLTLQVYPITSDITSKSSRQTVWWCMLKAVLATLITVLEQTIIVTRLCAKWV